MDTTQKKVAKQLAKALLALDLADWHARDWRDMSRQIQRVRARVSRLFTSTGYEFGESCSTRVKQRKA